MDVISRNTLSSTLNPNAPMFVPSAYRAVEDFSDQWWSLVNSSPWFRDYWLQERFEDPQAENDDDLLLLPDLDDLFESSKYDEPEEKEAREIGLDLITLGSLKWRKSRGGVDTPRFMEKAPKHVKVKASPRCIQQPR